MFIRSLCKQINAFTHQNFNLYRSFSTESNFYTTITSKSGILNITMCDQKTRNSLSLGMMQNVIANIEKHAANPKIRVIILGAEGPIFSAGHNLKELSSESGLKQQNEVFTLATKLMNKLIDCSVPIIARVDGLAAAAGCQLVAQCDLAYCSEKSTFSTPGANFGLFCSTPGVALARSIPKSTALKMLLTGTPISSKEAEAAGLVNKACLVSDLDTEIESVCNSITSKSRAVIELGKKFYYRQIIHDVRTAYKIGAQQMVENLQTPSGQEGIRSFIEKRKPSWTE